MEVGSLQGLHFLISKLQEFGHRNWKTLRYLVLIIDLAPQINFQIKLMIFGKLITGLYTL